jgi:hypothetical protein
MLRIDPLAYAVRLASLALQRVLFIMVGIVGVPLVAWVSTVAAHVSIIESVGQF